jgi:hypothetical protein
MRYRLERTVNKVYWQLGFQKGRAKVQSCITFGDRRSVENRWSYHGQCVQGLRPRLLTGLYDNVNFGLCDAGHLLEMSDGLGNALNARGLGSELLCSGEYSAHLTKNTDGLVGTLWQVNLILPSK